MDQEPNARLHEAVIRAMDAFWGSMVKSYPEVRTGGLPIQTVFDFEDACTEAGRQWVQGNKNDW